MLDLLEIPALAFVFGSPGVGEILVIGLIAVLLFGKRLPEVARSMGKSYNQFRRGLSDIQSDFNSQVYSEANSSDYSSYDVPQITSDQDQDVPTAPRFEPPTSEPTAADSSDSDVTVSDFSDSDVTVSDLPASDATVSDPETPADSEP